ncbi:MAG TPA: hypothetical protein VGQ67_06075 [Candidatus Polarisedimenticolia bacterium]|jgi:hypothetical protein|nr:hypothetical protein [Candidatus Polarisedimenticolia bacterium]
MIRPVRVSDPKARRVAALLSAAFLLGVGAIRPALAEMPGDVPDKLRFSIGGVAVETYTDAALGSTQSGLGASVNFEDVFNLPGSKNVWRFEMNWRLNKRQFIDLGYLELNRSGSRLLQQNVEWGDFIFDAGGEVKATFNTNFPYAAWRYSFLDLPQVRISGSAGIDYLSISSSLEANGNVTDNQGNAISGLVKEKVSVSAPVPQFGLQLDWALTKRLAVLIYNRQIYINNIVGITGGISETAMRLTWWYTKHLGFTGGLDKESIDLKSYESGDTKARFRYEVRGGSFYLNFTF